MKMIPGGKRGKGTLKGKRVGKFIFGITVSRLRSKVYAALVVIAVVG